jgi:hypothetical protein
MTQLHQLADTLEAAQGKRLKTRQTLKRLLIWTWERLSYEDKQTFIDHLVYPSLNFIKVRNITGDTDLDAKLWQTRSMLDHFEGADKAFLASLLPRMGVKGFKMSPKQAEWFKRLFYQWKQDIDRLLDEPEEEIEVTE